MKGSPKQDKKGKKPDPPRPEEKRPKRIPLPIVQEESVDEEMQELFDEDKVTHQHGQTEPERD